MIDLSFPIRPHFRWKVAPELVAAHATGHPLQSTVLTISCHAYTHVDAPLHYLVDGRDMASMPVDQWVGDAAVVDLTHLGANGEVTAADLERRAGHVRSGDIVLLRTDWPRRMGVDKEQFWKEGPWTGPSACEWLVTVASRPSATTTLQTIASATRSPSRDGVRAARSTRRTRFSFRPGSR